MNNHSSDTLRLSLRAIIYREGPWWFAHCLELDIVAEADSAADALKNLYELVEAQVGFAIENGDVEGIFKSAPPRFWKMYAAASDFSGRVRKTQKPIEHIEAREVVLV